MSKDLVDVDEFTSPVHVPEGIDSRDDAAGDVERIAQALANRTRNLKNILDAFGVGAAFEAQNNAFTGYNTFTQTLDGIGTGPVLSSNITPGDIGELWILRFSFKYAGGLYAHVYSGSNPSDANGIFAIVTNAYWDAPSDKWMQFNTGHGSTALILLRDSVRVSWVAAGTAPWGVWPTNAAFGKGVGSGGTAFELQVNGDARSSTAMIAPQMIVTGTGEYNYNVLTRTTAVIPVDLNRACGGTSVDAGGLLYWASTASRLAIPLRLARGSTFQKLEMTVSQISSSSITMELFKRKYSGAWTPGNQPVTGSAVASATTPGSAGNHTLVLDRTVTDWGAMDGLDEWFLLVTHAAGQGDFISGLYMRDVMEPGPRNW